MRLYSVGAGRRRDGTTAVSCFFLLSHLTKVPAFTFDHHALDCSVCRGTFMHHVYQMAVTQLAYRHEAYKKKTKHVLRPGASAVESGSAYPGALIQYNQIAIFDVSPWQHVSKLVLLWICYQLQNCWLWIIYFTEGRLPISVMHLVKKKKRAAIPAMLKCWCVVGFSVSCDFSFWKKHCWLCGDWIEVLLNFYI